MTQIVRTIIFSFASISVTAFAADRPSTCLEGYREAASLYRTTAARGRETLKAAAVWGGGGGVGVGIAAAVAATPVTGVIMGGLVAGYGGYSYFSTCRAQNNLENSAMILSVYENLRNTAGNPDIAEANDLLLETFANQGGASNCSLFAHEELPEQKRQALLADVSEEQKDATFKALVSAMESGELCNTQNQPQKLGKVIAKLRSAGTASGTF